MAEAPSIISILKTLDPRMFPKASLSYPLNAATRLVASSGSEVPPASMVTAMNLSLTPICLAKSVAEWTNSSPPPISAASPEIASKIDEDSFLPAVLIRH